MQTASILKKTYPHLACLALFLLGSLHAGSQVTVFSKNFDGSVKPYTASAAYTNANCSNYITFDNFTIIGNDFGVDDSQVTAIQTSVAITYAYTTNPSSTGVYYYRITAVEEDGHNIYSIISTDGKIIIEQDEALHAGTNSLDVDLRNFPPGIYIATLSGNNQVKYTKFLVR